MGTATGRRRGPRPGIAKNGARAGGRAAKRPLSEVVPSLREERKLLRDGGHVWLAGVDEVGRGALAGPVTVGVVVIDANTRSAPAGVRDSKLLTPAAREALVPKLRRWAPGHAVGHAEPDEIDRIGVIAALRLAAWRAVAALPVQPDCVLLDGNHDYFTEPPPRAEDDACDEPGEPLFELPASFVAPTPAEAVLWPSPPEVSRVVTRIKADLRCAAVAAASVLAKVERDAIMTARAADHPQYGWELNKGYSAPEHIAALREHGACSQHRRSWSLPGLLAAGAVPGQDMLDLAEAALDLSALDPELAVEADR